MNSYGISLPQAMVKDFLCRVTEDKQPRIYYSDFLQSIMGLPHDFFNIKFHGSGAGDALSRKKVSRLMPRGTPLHKAQQALVRGMRAKVFDIGIVRTVIFRSKPGKHDFTADELWTLMRRLGILTKPYELNDIFSHFDLRKNGA